jgi:hypothetical protein
MHRCSQVVRYNILLEHKPRQIGAESGPFVPLLAWLHEELLLCNDIESSAVVGCS